jgi:cytochrome c-type biogenesis protein CcmH/NrfF
MKFSKTKFRERIVLGWSNAFAWSNAFGWRSGSPLRFRPTTQTALAAGARPRRLLEALILTAAVFLFMGAGDPDARFRDLGHRMMCACGCSQILLECNHVGCTYSDKMRNQLMASIDKGNNDDLVLQGFVQEYGPTVIAAPTATGFNRVAWIMPFVALGMGITFVIYVVRSWRHRPEPALADGIRIPQGRELDDLRSKARRETDL